MLMFFVSNADSYSAAADIKCNHTCSFMYCAGGPDVCEGAGVRCCDEENLPCTADETWGVTCYDTIGE